MLCLVSCKYLSFLVEISVSTIPYKLLTLKLVVLGCVTAARSVQKGARRAERSAHCHVQASLILSCVCFKMEGLHLHFVQGSVFNTGKVKNEEKRCLYPV